MITLRLILVILCLALLFLEAFPPIIRSRPGWISFGWAGLFLLALLLLVEITV